MKNKGITILILISMLSLLLVDSVSAAPAQEPINLVTAIEVRGNQTIPTEEILHVVKTEVGQKIENEQLQADIQAIYDLGFFYNIRIDVENYLSGVKLIFEVIENPKISGVEIKGVDVISPEVLRELMEVKSGQLLNSKTLDKDLRAIEEYYRNQGLLLAYVADVSISPVNTLEITINEGFLNEIKIVGNEKTREYVIRRELDILPDQVFDLNKVQKDLRDIYNLGLFNSINQRIELAEENSNKVNLVIEVEEKKTGQFNAGAGYHSQEGWFGYMDYSEQNLLGRGQKLGFKWEFGQVTNYEINFYDPWALGEKFSFGTSLYNKTSRNGHDSTLNSDYTKKRTGASIQIGKPLAEDITGSLKFKYENTLIDYEKEGLASTTGDTRSLTFTTVRNTTDDPFNPSNGGRDMVSIEYAGQLFGGEFNFTKYNLDFRRYYPGFVDKHSWAFRLKGGLGTGVPGHEQFTLGGSQTLRGYDLNAIEGDRMVLFNAEYRFPIVKSLDGAVFTDLGNCWQSGEEGFDFDELKMSIGAGVRMNTPLGQIRLDYAFGEDGGQPHFSIGQTF